MTEAGGVEKHEDVCIRTSEAVTQSILGLVQSFCGDRCCFTGGGVPQGFIIGPLLFIHM